MTSAIALHAVRYSKCPIEPAGSCSLILFLSCLLGLAFAVLASFGKLEACFEAHFARFRPDANMADHSVGARDELHESEASEASVNC